MLAFIVEALNVQDLQLQLVVALGGGCIRQVSECGIILERFSSLVRFFCGFFFCGALAPLKQKTTKKY